MALLRSLAQRASLFHSACSPALRNGLSPLLKTPSAPRTALQGTDFRKNSLYTNYVFRRCISAFGANFSNPRTEESANPSNDMVHVEVEVPCMNYDSNRANYIQLIGYLGIDPEVRIGKANNNFIRTRLGVKLYPDTETSWFTLEARDDSAKILSILRKGELIYVGGPLSIFKSDTDGKTIQSLKVDVKQIAVVEKDGLPQNRSRESFAPNDSRASLSPSPPPETVDTESLWRELISNPSAFYDNRSDKVSGTRSARAPDFVRKGPHRMPLWLDGRTTPKWARDHFSKPSNEKGNGGSELASGHSDASNPVF